jgi:hypothetical protein
MDLRTEDMEMEPTQPLLRAPQATHGRYWTLPLTKADLDRGLTEHQLAALHEVLNLDTVVNELYCLGLQSLADDWQTTTTNLQP